MTGTEATWQAQGRNIAGKIWNAGQGRPVLAIHGWLDHADSFATLAPRLTGCHVVAVDKPGHGKSDHRSTDATYNIWEDLPALFAVMDALGWARCTLLGHSRGAMTAMLMAAARPERVEAVVALDALLPAPVPPERFVAQLRKHLDDDARLSARPERHFESAEAFVRRRVQAGNAKTVATGLADRALEAGPEGYRVRADARLQAGSAVKMSEAQIIAVMQAITAPVLSLWATDGLDRSDWARQIRALAETHVAQLMVDRIEGDHHCHLNPTAANEIAERITHFLTSLATPPRT